MLHWIQVYKPCIKPALSEGSFILIDVEDETVRKLNGQYLLRCPANSLVVPLRGRLREGLGWWKRGQEDVCVQWQMCKGQSSAAVSCVSSDWCCVSVLWVSARSRSVPAQTRCCNAPVAAAAAAPAQLRVFLFPTFSIYHVQFSKRSSGEWEECV